MAGGAPKGNTNARKARVWTQAINNAFKKRSQTEAMEELQKVANKLIDMALDGDLGAIKEIGDRLEGKPAQVIQGDSENPLVTKIERVIKHV